MSERIWWCELENGRNCTSEEYPAYSPWHQNCGWRILASPDSIIIERENGEWPEEARSVLNKAIYQWFEDGRGVTVSFEADLALDSLAEWSQSQNTDVASDS